LITPKKKEDPPQKANDRNKLHKNSHNDIDRFRQAGELLSVFDVDLVLQIVRIGPQFATLAPIDAMIRVRRLFRVERRQFRVQQNQTTLLYAVH
jgi:hypothetical protein